MWCTSDISTEIKKWFGFEQKHKVIQENQEPFVGAGRSAAKGFTLVEILMVLGLIMLILGFVYPMINQKRQDSLKAIARINMKDIAFEIERYQSDTDRLPNTLMDLLKSPPDVADKWEGPYGKEKMLKDPWGKKYEYRLISGNEGDGYDLFSYGSSKGKGTPKNEWIRLKK